MHAIVNNKGANYCAYCLEGTDREHVLRQLGAELVSRGFVKESYIDAVCERESIFPTGLPTAGVSIAIPHADASHVNEKAMIVGVLSKPVEFQVMGSTDEFINAELVFMLAIKDPQAQLDMLQKLLADCQNQQVLCTIRDHTDLKSVEEILEKLMY